MALISPRTKERARTLRSGQTDAERWLWRHLRNRQVGGWRFRRQHPIPPYIVDFACVEAKLIVEADGGQHAASPTDPIRDQRLRDAGWRILRFWNPDILKGIAGVIEMIAAELGTLGGRARG
jgi:primosomal protein N' (replication factor Y)